MPTITIRGTPIEFPDSGSSPNWAPAIIEFAQAVAESLNAVIGTFDVPAQIQVIDSHNPGTDIDVSSLNFPIANVRAAFIRYAVFRSTSTTSVYEAADLIVIFNPNNPTNQKWEITRGNITGDAKISFTITDAGQVKFSTTSISGLNHVGKITFEAKALEQN